MEPTLTRFDQFIRKCKDVFVKKTIDYGTAWRILRLPSVTDQLYIKAKRIRSIEEKGVQKVADSIDLEYVGLINYSIMALLQMRLTDADGLELSADVVEKYYDEEVKITRKLLQQKNHDYGEVWREMRVSSITDLILMKLLRIKQIEDNRGKTIISEGIDANYRDIINYAIFAMILIEDN
ncbi:MAG: DUF1599 domain-containing protein [Bacteroidota bacterium]